MDKSRLHHQKSLTKTRKQQRELKNFGQRQYSFQFFDADTGMSLGIYDFSGFDSEEAFVNADAWAGRNPMFNSIREIHIEEK